MYTLDDFSVYGIARYGMMVFCRTDYCQICLVLEVLTEPNLLSVFSTKLYPNVKCLSCNATVF